jgi:hypothetical protein
MLRSETIRLFVFRSIVLAVTLAACIPSVPAKVKKIVIDKTKSQTPAYDGRAFGKAGAYEKIVGQAYGELDPKDRRNKIIQDIDLAPRNSRGMIEYVATFTLVKPVDLSRGSHILIYEAVNRGRKIEPEIGDGGYTFLTSGWQGDIAYSSGLESDAPETIRVPVAKNADGSPVTGLVLGRIKNVNGNTAPLMVYTRAIPYMPASLDTAKATLTSRTSETVEGKSSPLTTIPGSEWAWADCTKQPFPGTPDPTKICLKNGFDTALLYEIVFTAKDPFVLGIGFAATRDIVSFFRNAEHDDDGTSNPLANSVTRVISRGTSQAGNFLRSFISLGFNEDEQGKIVWDGAMPHIAGRQIAMNVRFAMPDGASDPYEPGSDGALWWSDWTDTVRGRKQSGLLDRCNATHTCPKIIETFGATEFWALRLSPDLVGTSAKEDIPVPANVRRYYFPGTTHGGGAGGFSTAAPAAARGRAGVCALPANPNPQSDTMRALLVAMSEWVTKDAPPPPSKYPTLAHGDLVPPTRSAVGFPAIPGITFVDNFENPLFDYDWGDQFNYLDVSGVITKEPPAIKKVIPLLVPKVNGDGNEIVGGVASVLHQAPLGTYLGWNAVASGFFKGQFCAFTGGYLPFAKTKAERTAAADPRLSLEERYGTQANYVAAVRKAADQAVHERFLLPEDAERLVKQATASKILPGE